MTKAFIKAAGLGTRLRPFTESVPKPLMPVLGVPIIQYGLDLLAGAGIDEAIVNIHHLPRAMRDGIASLDPGGVRIRISDESRRLLGSAGCFLKSGLELREPFLILNGDAVCELDLQELCTAHEAAVESGVWITLALHETGFPDRAYREVKLSEDGRRVAGLGEVVPGKPFYIGTSVVDPRALEGLAADEPADFISDVLVPAIERGKVAAHRWKGVWLDVGNPASWWQSHRVLMELLENPGGMHPRWEKRLTEMNRRVGDLQWVRKTVGGTRPDGWVGPCYWGAEESPLAGIGPEVAVYEGVSRLSPSELHHGVFFEGSWASIEKG